VRGGVTTFFTMSYILFVQPAFLAAAGMDPGAVLTATCVASGVATLIMGLWARYPVALAPGMGVNAFFAFTVCGAMGVPWQQALGLVFMSGVLFLALGLFGLRERVVAMVPTSLQHAIAAGIGLFITFLGLKEAGVIVPDPNTFVDVGALGTRQAPVLTALVGVVVAGVAAARKHAAAVVCGMLASLIVGLALGVVTWQGAFAAPPSLAPTAFQLSLHGLFTPTRLGLVLLFLYTDLFDTVGTLIGVGRSAGLVDADGKMPRVSRAFFADAFGTVVGAVLGTSTVTSYIESGAGVAAGARTGLAACVTGLLFFAALFFAPMAQTVGGGVPVEVLMFASTGPVSHTIVLHPVIAPALVLVGAMMAGALRDIDWGDPVEALPAFATLVGIPLTFSIADGISFGVIAASALRLATGRPASAALHGVALALIARWVAELV
jgi:AGZA family xanthine/uracil permease-like MFS transporter